MFEICTNEAKGMFGREESTLSSYRPCLQSHVHQVVGKI